ncbi:unnamed protein product [Pleuronectes platessa]|uniref:Uncharacterized protein n=1 Tax=Pleuronectes platessa TaxID=8262 RepID=A0A9N7TMK9_PLEPL|nr:unnamed protein product [Pleuronectes platessa]
MGIQRAGYQTVQSAGKIQNVPLAHLELAVAAEGDAMKLFSVVRLSTLGVQRIVLTNTAASPSNTPSSSNRQGEESKHGVPASSSPSLHLTASSLSNFAKVLGTCQIRCYNSKEAIGRWAAPPPYHQPPRPSKPWLLLQKHHQYSSSFIVSDNTWPMPTNDEEYSRKPDQPKPAPGTDPQTLRWERDRDRDTVEAVIGQVSGEDAKTSGQRVTERGRLSHPADLAKTDETISSPRPGQLFNPAPHPGFEGSFPTTTQS